MRKAQFIFSFIFFISLITFSQGFGLAGNNTSYDPVRWSGSVEKISDATYILHYNATVEKDWYIYAQESESGIPFSFEFLNSENNIVRDGLAKESETITFYDDVFQENATKFLGQTPSLSQNITLLNTDIKIIKSVISYQVCKEVCIPQEFYITHQLETKEVKVFTNFTEFENYGTSKTIASPSSDLQEEVASQNDTNSNWTVFILSFLGGLAALLTPCVFPMIPMTVSYFTKQSKSRAAGIKNAIIYGLSIIVIYVFIGFAVTTIFGETAIVELSTSVTFNVIFFVLLVIFAISFFGAFEIMLPQKWANKIDSQADRGGLIGIFFMALALAIVSFSCTGPIVGTALVQSVVEGGITPVISMLGFSTAIALPFALFALFPGWLNTLPKSGGWLNTVKVVLGFLELALAFKFLSNADLVSQSHFLEREVFLALIIAIMVGMALYLFGKLKLPHDSDLSHISVGRLLLGILTVSFVVYMIPGLWGAPLKLISGFPPPLHYSESPYGVGGGNANAAKDQDIPNGAELGPHDIISFTDYEAGIAYAKQQNKPILLDFTGYACINCRRMEERVWSDPKVLNILKNDIVLISLYGDSRELLPESEQTVSPSGRRIKTVGNKWSNFQIENYNILAAPYYVLLDHDESPLNQPVAYTPDIDVYLAWLEEGITNFNRN
ncbi:protein-disulfide reductase DsbD family protein [Dokdonia sp. Hel_I_53]|uniref:protein-disulfide reductase DsbD family protein n=1 Tax=Dokdonia sp. Hel_I_53 TaxID=1566287 RepID=UPI0011A9544D|nr:thioredoxin family protein [Dokdonia sp. Hel_I_53]